MNIRQKILLLIVLAFIGISSVGGYSIYQSRRNASEVKTVTEGVVPSTLASSDLVSRLKDVQLGVMAVVYAPDEMLAKQAKEKLESQKAGLRQGLEVQLSMANSAAQKGLVQQAKESLDNYFSAIDECAGFKMDGQKELAEASLYASVAQYQNELESIVSTLRIEKNRTKDETITTLNHGMASTALMVTVITVLLGSLLSVLGWVLYRSVTRPISRMQSMMSEIAISEDYSQRLPVEQDDEIGRSTQAFNLMLDAIQHRSDLLRKKTNDIQAMLQNVPQGILTVVDGNKIHPEYSSYLETILETQQIAGQDYLQVLFSHANLGADAMSQLEAIGGVCIGEDVMNFDFNRHLMVSEFEKTMPDGRTKILELNWSPIVDASDTITALLLCVRDVTDLRKLAAEANAQRRELEIIGEILGVTHEKFHDFIANAIHMIDENEALIREHVQQDDVVIAHLFRNMHTIKGNARTYGLTHLANVVHHAEHTYDQLRKAHPEIVWDQQQLQTELAQVRDIVEHYADVNENSLGRRGPGRRGNVERYLMVDKEHIAQTLEWLSTVNTASLQALADAHQETKRTLKLLGTEPLHKMLESVTASLPSLANELGKLSPTIEIQDAGVAVHHQISGILKNVFMHLIRNAMDHGLEPVAERIEAGKTPQGHIHIAFGEVMNGQQQLMIRDDGRGLALARIREKAIERGLIMENELISDDRIANLIFHSGFSTADKVTEISGRGVGMDAVYQFLKREQGHIEIRFTDDRVGAEYRTFEIRIELPQSLFETFDASELQSDTQDGDAIDMMESAAARHSAAHLHIV
jgi:two-component system chemotaxis sensor kinase CheA